MIFSSHILTEVSQLCTRAVILRAGRLVREVDLKCGAERAPLCFRLQAACGAEKLFSALRALPGVTLVAPLQGAPGEAACTVTFRPGTQEPQRAIFRLLTEMDAPLLALVPEREELEALFMRISAGEETEAET